MYSNNIVLIKIAPPAQALLIYKGFCHIIYTKLYTYKYTICITLFILEIYIIITLSY